MTTPLARARRLTLAVLLALPLATSSAHAFAPIDDAPGERAEASADGAELAAWRAWAEEHRYKLASDDERRILVLARSAANLRRYAKVVREVSAEVDAFAPEESAVEGGGTGELPWIVLFELEDLDDQLSALQVAARIAPYLEEWVRLRGENIFGFLTERPLLGAWILKVPGREEFDAGNELAHRLTRLLLQRRFGHLPHWLASGLAWRFEQNLRGDIDCFPDRDGFVAITEHDGWGSSVRTELGKASGTFDLGVVAAWSRGVYRDREAGLSWALASFLCEEHAPKLGALLAELGRENETRGRVTHADGTWERVVGYELDADVQLEVLRRHAGDDVMEAFSRAGSRGRFKKRVPRP